MVAYSGRVRKNLYLYHTLALGKQNIIVMPGQCTNVLL